MEIKNIICKLFGHKISQTELLVANIKLKPVNRGLGENILRCKRCGWEIDLNAKE